MKAQAKYINKQGKSNRDKYQVLISAPKTNFFYTCAALGRMFVGEILVGQVVSNT